ncbi:MAG: hypothetical protein CMLOHMNK_02729 [Steroidobacteraceae bacterium]|nr:hypothetical protein [Steroidobacteraceae bacterium]
MWRLSQSSGGPGNSLGPMSARYYTHFVTPADEARQAHEWSGVVELGRALDQRGGTGELARLLAQSFELDTEDIRILHWARLH